MTQSPFMFPAVDTKDAAAVAREVRGIFSEIFPGEDDSFIAREFQWIVDAFEGRCPGYLAIDARYHDLEHTLQGTLCLMELLRGRHFSLARPPLTRRMFGLALLAILMHDTGYLKHAGDPDGTGAKYTLTHVRRSADFAREFLQPRGFLDEDIIAIQNMIRCTGVNADLAAIPFSSELERVVGYALGTADLLGQMAADDYVEKLPVLFQEFSEAVEFSGTLSAKTLQFRSAEELVRNTPVFWQRYVFPKVNEDFGGLYRYLAEPYPDGNNDYLNAIRANLLRIEQRSARATAS
jgi:hypothetical protein